MAAATYAISDLHGRYDLWSKARDYLQEDDTLICLGDCIDRGPDGIKIVDEMRARPNTTYIKGNHEDMAAAAIYDLCQEPEKSWHGGSGDIWFSNGGYKTYEALTEYPEQKQLEYADFFRDLPLQYEYLNAMGEKVILTHAGFTPGKRGDLLWDRASFHDIWPSIYKDTKIIHGHTPVQYLEFWFGYNEHHIFKSIDMDEVYDRWEPHAIWYCGGHKCDIDLGTAASSKTMLLNLDTWEEIYFFGD